MPACQRHFAAVGRQAYCSTACRKTAFRRRHQDPPAAIVIRAARPRREYTIYECPSCGQRQAGRQRCDDCGIFGRRIGNRAHARTARNPSRSATYSNRNLDNLSASDVSHAILQGMRSGEAYTHVPTRRSASVAATANVGPGAGCHC